jgi:apolipoprotein N-acyltransferase
MRSSLIVGCKRREPDSSPGSDYNSVVYLDRTARHAVFYDKIHLSPVSEHRPKFADAVGILPAAKSAKKPKSRFQHGSEQRIFSLATASQSYRFAPMICYDLFFSVDHRRLVNRANDTVDPFFFICTANERGARESTLPELSSAMQRFRAIESGRSYARNCEGGISQIVDGYGRPVPTIGADIGNGQHVLIARIPISDRQTVYVQWGEWLPMLACIYTGSLLAISLGRRTLASVRRRADLPLKN